MEKKIIHPRKNIFTFFPTLPNETVSARNSRKIIEAFGEKASESLRKRKNFNLKELLIYNQKEINNDELDRSTPCIDGPLSEKMDKVFFYMLDNQTKEDWFTASKRGDIKVLQEIYQNYRKINVHLKDGNDKTALEYACQHRHQDAIDYLDSLYLERKIVDKKPLDSETEKKWWKAVVNGNKETIKNILAHYNVDVNAKNEEGDTPLHTAAMKNSKEVAEILIKEGADVNATDNQGWTPLHWAAIRNSKEVAEILLREGADVIAKNNSGGTPLHHAPTFKEVAKILIQHGADVNAKDEDGWTALHHAAYHNSKEVAELFIEHGADVNAKDKDGRTPLRHAAHNNSKEVLEILLKEGADVNTKDKRGQTPLHDAATENSKEVAEILIRAGADVNAKDLFYGYTPLHYAARWNYIELAQLLIAEGADKRIKNNNNQTPLDLARKEGHKEMIDLLKPKGIFSIFGL